MKNKIVICLFIMTLLFITGCSKEKKTNDNKLYDAAIKYVIDSDSNPDKNNDRYKLFADYTSFEITKDDKYRYAYMWIAFESYYVKENKIVSSSGSSMAYKFTFDLNNDKVIKVEHPKDGKYYVSSIKEMFPDDIEDKVINFEWKDDKLIKEVRDYYKDLEDKSIYYYTGKELIKLDK